MLKCAAWNIRVILLNCNQCSEMLKSIAFRLKHACPAMLNSLRLIINCSIVEKKFFRMNKKMIFPLYLQSDVVYVLSFSEPVVQKTENNNNNLYLTQKKQKNHSPIGYLLYLQLERLNFDF